MSISIYPTSKVLHLNLILNMNMELTKTGVHIPKFLAEPQSLSSKKERERKRVKYIPPAPRPHHVRSAPSQTRLLHSKRLDSSNDLLDNSFHMYISSGTSGTGTLTFFRQYFEIQERLGYGSFGDVYRVKSLIDNKEYAVKKSRNTYSGEIDRSRQLNEVQRVVNIPSNEHLVELERAWEEDGHLYLQMELCTKSLNQHIEEGNFLDEQESWNVFIDILQALRHLHKYKLVHMDVKPDNIFLSRDITSIYKLGDFGIVISLEDNKDVTEYTDGDSRYLAPEVMQGFVTTKADVFCLGMTILEISSNVDLPKGGELWHKLRSGNDFPLPSHIQLPESLAHVIKMMIIPDHLLRPEIEEIFQLQVVKYHANRRYWMLKRNYIRTKLRIIPRLWCNLFNFFMSIFCIFWGKLFRLRKVQDEIIVTTPKPKKSCKDLLVPDLMLNDNSFSDVDDDLLNSNASTPIFSSTPISTSKTKSTNSRLRNGRSSRMGSGNLQGKLKPMGSPTSRNLLKEFEAVSDD